MKKIPLSSIEKSFYYQTRLDSEDDSGNIIHEVIFKDAIKAEDVKKALLTIMSNNASLRYKLLEEDGVPYFIDSGIAQPEESASLELLKRPFNLQQDVLLRLVIDGSKVYIASHHIIFDAISWNLFIGEFLLALKGKHPQKTIRPQPADSRMPQNDTLYWADKLSGIERLVSIQKSSDSTKKRSSKTISYKMQQTVIDKLRIYAKSKKVSLNTLFMYSVSIVLYRLTEQHEMVISTPINTRALDDMEIHCDINVLPCPVLVSSNELISKSLQIFSDSMWRAVEKRNFSLLELTKALGADGTDGLYNVMVEYSQKQTAPEIKSDTIIENKTPKIDIVVSAEDFEGNITLSIEYDTTRADDIFADTLLNKVEKVLDSIITNDDKRISDIELNDPQEIEDLLLLGRGEEKKLSGTSMTEQFLKQVSNGGKRTAIRHNGSEYSYEELSMEARKIASALLDNGISPQDRVGIHMERSMEYIATILAIWMLNAVYVPLDSNNPEKRNRFFLEQAGIGTIVVNGTNAMLTDATVVDVATIKTKHSNIAIASIKVDDVAYIIFTSGSTGTPKGITISHSGFLNHVDIMVDELSLTENDVIAQTAPASFDISVWQLTCALAIGATIEIIDQNLLIDVEHMYHTISKNNISVLEVVPSLLSAYLDTEDRNPNLASGLSHVKVLTTGEAITNDIAQKWVRLYPKQSLTNAYGPAEASDDTHFYAINHDSLHKHTSIPIGKTLNNIHTYILDADQRLSPRGLVGEIVIGGIAVADGYTNDPARTDAAFINDGFIGTGKMYKTGDYGRWLPDGNLAYNGRRDNQIKIRGQRFELGEIENVLKEIPEVEDAAAIIHDYKANKRIVGFVSVNNTHRHQEDVLKEELSQKLPNYMIPWRIIDIDMIPRNNNGKTDRHKLAEIAKNLDNSTTVATNTGLLSIIIEAYSELLGQTVTADTNYFDAGGDSLLSIKVVSRLRSRGLAVSVKDVIVHQTPAELAKVAEVNRFDEDVVIVPNDFVSPIQQKYILESGNFADHGEVQAAVLKNPKLTSNNISQLIKKIREAYEQLGIIEMTDIHEIQSYDEITGLVEAYRKKMRLREHMAISIPISMKSELGIVFIIHHYVFDIYSWSILRNDIDSLLNGKSIPSRNDTKLLRYFFKHDATNVSLRPKNTPVTTCNTKAHTLKFASPQNISLMDDGMLLIYATAKAIMKSRDKNSLSFGIERSARIDSRDYDLSDTVGWATYIKRASIYQDDDFNTFHKRYILNDENRRENLDGIDIVINYVGKVINPNDDLRVINSSIYKKIPFIEVDIELNNAFVICLYQENIGLKDEEVAHIFETMREILNKYDTTTTLNDAQQSNILERISRRAGRN